MSNIDPYTFQALAIKHALILYAKTGIKANRAYTPTNMLRAAGRITGIHFKRGQYLEAAEALDNFVKEKHEAL